MMAPHCIHCPPPEGRPPWSDEASAAPGGAPPPPAASAASMPVDGRLEQALRLCSRLAAVARGHGPAVPACVTDFSTSADVLQVVSSRGPAARAASPGSPPGAAPRPGAHRPPRYIWIRASWSIPVLLVAHRCDLSVSRCRKEMRVIQRRPRRGNRLQRRGAPPGRGPRSLARSGGAIFLLRVTIPSDSVGARTVLPAWLRAGCCRMSKRESAACTRSSSRATVRADQRARPRLDGSSCPIDRDRLISRAPRHGCVSSYLACSLAPLHSRLGPGRMSSPRKGVFSEVFLRAGPRPDQSPVDCGPHRSSSWWRPSRRHTRVAHRMVCQQPVG
jgi:hypothetical protein